MKAVQSFLLTCLRHFKTCLVLAMLCMFGSAQAHSSSNSFLTLSAEDKRLTLRADVNLRDVDLIFNLDQDRNGQVTWAELLSKEIEITKWLEQGIQLKASKQACQLGIADIQASEHADGLYISTLWYPTCNLSTFVNSLNEAALEMRYSLMFAQDNLHRGLLKLDLPELQSSFIFSPDQPQTMLTQENSSVFQVFARYLLEGVWHIWIGIDHILFLLSLLVLAPLQAAKTRVTHWQAVPRARTAVIEVLTVVTAFTLAHSITLGASIMKWLEPAPSLIEPAIAISVVIVAINNLLGWSAVKRWPLAFVFGLIHGFGFANVLVDLGLPTSALASALGGFNVGVELGQLAIVCVFLPLAWLLRNTMFYRWGVVVCGSTAIAVIGFLWALERTGLI
jgi:hypothetical protein